MRTNLLVVRPSPNEYAWRVLAYETFLYARAGMDSGHNEGYRYTSRTWDIEDGKLATWSTGQKSNLLCALHELLIEVM